MLNETDKAVWESYIKTVTPLNKVSKFKKITQVLKPRLFRLRRRVSDVPTILDLHGFTLEEAFCIFNRFLNYHLEHKTSSVIVITGKGKEGKGVLKAEFPKWIDNPDIKSKVRSVSQPISYGGGAFELILKQRKN